MNRPVSAGDVLKGSVTHTHELHPPAFARAMGAHGRPARREKRKSTSHGIEEKAVTGRSSLSDVRLENGSL